MRSPRLRNAGTLKAATMMAVILTALSGPGTAFPADAEEPVRTVGIAIGYPPYQFIDTAGAPSGADAELARAIMHRAELPFRFMAADWDVVYLNLLHRTRQVDLLAGAESNFTRKLVFDFTEPWYHRRSAVFVREDSPWKHLADLNGKIITGDRDSYFGLRLDQGNWVVVDTSSKEESFRLLAETRVDAVVAPRETGQVMARRLGLKLRMLPESSEDPGSPVSFALPRDSKALREKLDKATRELRANGTLASILRNHGIGE